jgi:hypothetical protein
MTENNNDGWLISKPKQEKPIENTKEVFQGPFSPQESEIIFDEPNLTEEQEAWLDADIPLTDRAEAYIATIERRIEKDFIITPSLTACGQDLCVLMKMERPTTQA